MEYQYHIHIWLGSESNYTGVYYRTISKASWLAKIVEVVKSRKIDISQTRLVVFPERTIWSFAVSDSLSEAMWSTKPLFASYIKHGVPHELKEVLK